MTSLDLPLLEINGIKFTVIPPKDALPGLFVHESQVTVHCQGHTEEWVLSLAKATLQKDVAARIGELLNKTAKERPHGLRYRLDHGFAIASGSQRALTVLQARVSIGEAPPFLVYLSGPHLSATVVEAPVLFIDEDNDTRRVVNRYLARVHLQVARTDFSHDHGPADYVANFAIRYQVEFAPGGSWQQSSGKV